jgi:spermidine/putrescine transport system substrate-binding protein
LKTGGKPVTYMAPKEGALSWIDGLSIPAGAKNIPQIYEFLKFAYQPSSGGLLGTNTGYNPVSKGASQYLTPATKQSVADAFPKDALDKLWWIPPEPIWYAAALAEFRDKFVAA